MVKEDSNPIVDREITNLCCVYDPADKEGNFISYIIGAGWDKKIHVWADEKEEEVKTNKVLPREEKQGHSDDIMSCIYDPISKLIFTGAHDGTLLAWSFESGQIKHHLHFGDKEMTSKDYIAQSKSIDCLLILQKKRKLLSGSAD
jgi:WD40 repeat protein